MKFLSALPAVRFLVCPKGSKSAGKAFSGPQGKKHACVRARINTVEKGVTAVPVNMSLKPADCHLWCGWVSTLLSYGRAYSSSPSGSQLKDSGYLPSNCTCTVTLTAAPVFKTFLLPHGRSLIPGDYREIDSAHFYDENSFFKRGLVFKLNYVEREIQTIR